MTSQPERRQGQRLKIQCLIRYKELPLGLERVTNIQNLSFSGLMFEVSHPIETNAILDVSLNLPVASMPIQIQAKVTYCNKMKDSDLFQVGVVFNILSDSDKTVIADYIEKEKGKSCD